MGTEGIQPGGVCADTGSHLLCSQCLEEDARCRSRKQHHTAKRIYDRLVDEHGFTGGETTVRRLVRQLKEKTQEPFVPLAFPAGDAMQIDWGEATVYIIRT